MSDTLHDDTTTKDEPAPNRFSVDAAVQTPIDPDAAIDVTVYLSTDRVDDDNPPQVVLPDGVDLGRFVKNGPLMLCHDYEGKFYPLPVGQVVWVKRRPRGLLGGIKFATGTQMARECKALVEEGVLRGVSVGFKPLEISLMTRKEADSRPDWKEAYDRRKGKIEMVRRWKLLELSLTPIPTNEDALIQTLTTKGLTRPEWLKPKTTEPAMPEDEHGHDDATPARDDAIRVAVTKAMTPEALESKGLTLGPLGTSALSAVIDRMSGTLTGYLYSLNWNDADTPEVVAEKCRAACDEFCGAVSAAWAALKPLDKTGEKAAAAVEAVCKGFAKGTLPDKGPPDECKAAAASDDDSDEPDDDEDDGPIGRGHFVRVTKGPHRGAVGKVASVHRSGLVPDVEDDVPCRKGDHGCRVKCYKAMGDGYKETDHHVGCKVAHVEKTADLKPPSRKKGLPDPLKLPPIAGKTDDQVAAERLAEVRKAFSPAAVATLVEHDRDRRMGAV